MQKYLYLYNVIKTKQHGQVIKQSKLHFEHL
jgi:hypothetical protein